MRKIRTFLAAVMAFGVVMSLTACGSTPSSSANAGNGQETYVFKVGHVQPQDHPYHTGMVYMNELLK